MLAFSSDSKLRGLAIKTALQHNCKAPTILPRDVFLNNATFCVQLKIDETVLLVVQKSNDVVSTVPTTLVL